MQIWILIGAMVFGVICSETIRAYFRRRRGFWLLAFAFGGLFYRREFILDEKYWFIRAALNLYRKYHALKCRIFGWRPIELGQMGKPIDWACQDPKLAQESRYFSTKPCTWMEAPFCPVCGGDCRSRGTTQPEHAGTFCQGEAGVDASTSSEKESTLQNLE